MNTPKTIVESLWNCSRGNWEACLTCPYREQSKMTCADALMRDAAMCIQRYMFAEDVQRDIAAEATKKRKRKEKRQRIIGGLLGMLLGSVLCFCGYGVTSWQFWVITGISCAHILNMGL